MVDETSYSIKMPLLDTLDVSNVYIYIGDAVRWDSLPEEISKKGITVKSVAASIHTPSSFASIFTGAYLPQHGVDDFSTSLHNNQRTLFDVFDGETAFSNSINQIFNTNPTSESILNKTLGVESRSHEVLKDISPPFLMVERGRGGHAPYGNFDGNGWEYFVERGGAPIQRYKREYRNGIKQDKEWFFDQLCTLEARDLLADTLVLYMSDHGELLGENGILGHNGPIHPKLAYIPTVFIHSELPDQDVTDRVFRHIDVLPTLDGLFGNRTVKPQTGVGRDITSEHLANQGACYYSKTYNLHGMKKQLSYHSVWEPNGGHLFARSPRSVQLQIWLGKIAKSPKRKFMLKNLLQSGSWYFKRRTSFDEPDSSPAEAKKYLEEISQHKGTVGDRVDIDKDQLRNLGYIN